MGGNYENSYSRLQLNKVNTYIRTYMHSIHALMHAYIPAYIQPEYTHACMHACMCTHIHTVHTYVHTYITLHISTVSFAHIPMTLALTLYLGTYTSKVIPNIFRLYRLWLYSGYFCIYGFLCEYPDDTPSEIVFCVFLHLRFPVCISHPPPL